MMRKVVPLPSWFKAGMMRKVVPLFSEVYDGMMRKVVPLFPVSSGDGSGQLFSHIPNDRMAGRE